jgi:hypothetical protein
MHNFILPFCKEELQVKCNWEKWNAIATIIMAVGGLIGLFYLISEFGELRKSNEIALNTVRQSYRPLAIVRFTHQRPDLAVVNHSDLTPLRHFNFAYTEQIVNKGLGVLIYLGYVSYLSQSELDFRSLLIDDKIPSVSQDSASAYARRRPIAPGETLTVFTIWEDVPFSPQYFAYSLHLYEDQDGGLYDTEHLNVVGFENPFSEKGKIRTRLEPGTAVRETYHYYTNEEKAKLIKSLKKLNSSIADALTLRK